MLLTPKKSRFLTPQKSRSDQDTRAANMLLTPKKSRFLTPQKSRSDQNRGTPGAPIRRRVADEDEEDTLVKRGDEFDWVMNMTVSCSPICPTQLPNCFKSIMGAKSIMGERHRLQQRQKSIMGAKSIMGERHRLQQRQKSRSHKDQIRGTPAVPVAIKRLWTPAAPVLTPQKSRSNQMGGTPTAPVVIKRQLRMVDEDEEDTLIKRRKLGDRIGQGKWDEYDCQVFDNLGERHRLREGGMRQFVQLNCPIAQ